VPLGADSFLVASVYLGVWSIARSIMHRNAKEFFMSFLAWIILGLVSGYIASKLVNKTGEGILLDIVLGVVGAFVGGWLFTTFGASGVTGLNVYSMVVAVIGAVVVLVIYHAFARRRV
jgi:uncharacterized membrane protein YeaQ/YmgE (transglycosylase-associated protein family)